ncbi:TspO/MBR family protein [Niveispirillum sp.]|uniref:TspO/MBR family protein n=1 Tax=Niveispirillum sp. TaxID=1917217 RepID=UPI0025DB510F|nr:TspO/MBR family protein [Niveispirillum sp.]
MAALMFIGIVVIAASSGAIFKPGEWYDSLRKPTWTPPNWAFPVVWTLLYAAIAYAGWRVWTLSGWSLPMAFWGVQIIVNAMWSWMFFGLRRMRLALADVIALWVSILGFILTSWPVSEIAALLFLPYLAWVTIAAFLNYSVLRLNSRS